MRKTATWTAFGLMGFLALTGFSVQLSAQAGAQQIERGELRPVVAGPAMEFGGRGATLGTAGDLSAFSVMKFNGVLTSAAGQPRTGAAGITFAFYTEQAGGSPLWMETQNVSVQEGRYAVLLGSASTEGLPVDLFASGEARWLGIRVGVEPEQARILLVSVPYALKAAEAERLGGLTAEDFVLAGQFSDQVRKEVEEQVAAEAEKIQAATISVGGAKEITEAGVRSTFTDTNTTEVVFIDQLGTGMGLRARSTSGTAITGASTALTGPAPGVSGVSKADIGKGILGRVTHPTGLTMGIRGETLSTAGRGIVGIAEATSGPTIGIQAVTFSPEGVGIELVTKTVGGQLFRGLSGQPAVEVFSISGTGDVVAASFAGDGSLLINVPGAAGGTVTSVATGLGLTGGTITTSGTLSIDTAVVPQLNAANTFTTGTQTVQTGAATTTGLVVQGAAGQTASLLEVQDSAGVKLASVEADGTLEITSGDIKIRGAGRGFFMMSPDGTECARIILGNSGQLHVTSIVCPIP